VSRLIRLEVFHFAITVYDAEVSSAPKSGYMNVPASWIPPSQLATMIPVYLARFVLLQRKRLLFTCSETSFQMSFASHGERAWIKFEHR